MQDLFRSKRFLAGFAIAAAAAAVAGGCSSSSKSTGSTATTTGGSATTAGGGPTITVGILTDLTGPAASAGQTTPIGARAGAVIAGQQGYHLKFVEADSQTSPSAVLTAAQKLVEQDHVNVVLILSALAFGATGWLTQHGVPVVGVAEDGPEWITSPNMFSSFGFVDATKVGTNFGQFMKSKGVTTVGAVGYGISPTSSDAAKSAAASSQAAGLKVGYLNSNLPFGTTDVTPIALQMKKAGVDGFTADTDPNTNFALVTALRQAGDNPKVAIFPTGYGGDLTQAGPGAIQEGQGVYFTSTFEPVEMHTAATQQFQGALKSVGVTSDPTYAEYGGYASVALLVAGLKAAGADYSYSGLIKALTSVTNFNAWGLLGSHSFSMADRGATGTGVDDCTYVTKLSGSKFELVQGADPVCGTTIAGKSV